MKDEINLNLSSCLVERTNIGSYEYINILFNYWLYNR